AAHGPVTIAGTLAQLLAEALSGMAFAQAVRPGAPVVFGTFASSISMQSGAPTFGTPEPNLVLFAAAITDARRGVLDKKEAFEQLGITQADLTEGAKDMLGLLYKTSDAFKEQSSVVERTSAARKIFGRGGAEMVEWLSRGSEAMREMSRRAEELGLALTTEDIVAAKGFNLELQDMHARMDALWLQVGTRAIPALSALMVTVQALFKSFESGIESDNLFKILTSFPANLAAAAMEANRRIRASLTELGEGGTSLIPENIVKPVKDVKSEFAGLSTILDQVRGSLAAFGTEEEQIAYDALELAKQVAAATGELRTLHAEGKLTAEDFRREMAALVGLPAAIQELVNTQLGEFASKRAEAAAAVAAEEDLFASGVDLCHLRWKAANISSIAVLLRARRSTGAAAAMISQWMRVWYDDVYVDGREHAVLRAHMSDVARLLGERVDPARMPSLLREVVRWEFQHGHGFLQHQAAGAWQHSEFVADFRPVQAFCEAAGYALPDDWLPDEFG
ncbi:hypothetical protein LCGC14_1400930, partial [marine sediment metagenome]